MKDTDPAPILCGTDLSTHATQASNTAAVLAARLGAPLVLAHATGLPWTFQTPNDTRLSYESQTAQAREPLHQEAERLRQLGASIEETISVGTPAEVLRQLAQQRGARLLVVSSLGHSAAVRWMLGSVAERAAESAPVPTLVVRDSAPFQAWALGHRPLKIFVGVDFSASSDAALAWVAELSLFGPCEVAAGCVDWPPEEALRLGLSGPLGPAVNLPIIQQVLERDLRDKVARLLGNTPARICVRGNWGRTDLPLVEMAVESQADLLVIGTHQRHGWGRMRHGSVSRDILRHAPMSVVCVPTPRAKATAGPRTRQCRRVLVAVDLEEPYGFAASHGYSIVDPGGTVHLIHVAAPHSTLPGGSGSGSDFARLVAEREGQLHALAPGPADAHGVTTEVEVTESRNIGEAICAAAERFGADVICVGSHTRLGYTAKLLGSVSLAVLQKSRRPVLVVRPPAE